jgi:acyl-CoA synthetase (AMP-forming)/AMP-acid ligase II/acyl carrier protein
MYSSRPATLAALLEQNAGSFGAAVALCSEGTNPCSHRQLYEQVVALVLALNHLGIGRNDRVAIVLPQGPELAMAFLAVAAGATAAPLNPAYTESEFRFYLEDLQARALVLPPGDTSPARTAAAALGVPVIELISETGVAGHFQFSGAERQLTGPPGFGEAEDIALVLHTSGTTSRPKLVPLTHTNLLASMQNIAATLQLQPAALSAGGSVVCTRAVAAQHFLEWLQTWQPTWYSAVPTLHQAILAHAQNLPQPLPPSSLRFIRSSSAALPPPVLAALETTFGVPVIESYGMTEAAHQMASNPLPPRARKPGSVGLAAGLELAILDAAGTPLPTGGVGEVAIRGRNVTRGYANNPPANAAAFTSGWFRTGDQGYLDEEGYLFLTGRLKELINRGGEKMAPREIDDVLLAHRDIRQAVAFAVPHPTLGEDVAAAVVLHSGARVGEVELRAFAAERLPAFKVPSRIIFIHDLPKGPTGKLQRIGLADRLAAELAVTFQQPATATEQLVADTIGAVLGRERIGRDDNFFSLGGDSLRATQVLTRLETALAISIPLPLLFRHPTPTQLARQLELLQETEIAALATELDQLTPAEQSALLKDCESHPAESA